MFDDQCKHHSIVHLTSAPIHQPSNGEAEWLVGVFKQAMKCDLRIEKKSKQLALRDFLQQYQTVPNCTTGRTSVEMMLGRQVHPPLSDLSMIRNSYMALTQPTKSNKSKFDIADYVYYRNYTAKQSKWFVGRIMAHIGTKGIQRSDY